MAQRPHTSSGQRKNENLTLARRKEGRKRTYYNGDSDRVDLLCSVSQVQQWTPLEKLIEGECRDLERSQRKRKSGILER